MIALVPFARFMLVAAAMIICVTACGGTGAGPAGGSVPTTAAPRAPGDSAGQTACAGSRDQFTGLQTSNAGAAYDQMVFTLTAPGVGTLVGTVSGTCPVAVPGPWVITHVTYTTPPPA